jgi:hypothetical protein
VVVEGEVRIYFRLDKARDDLEEKLKASMRTLGYSMWAAGAGMGERELCFLPTEAVPDYFDEEPEQEE